MKRYQFDAQKSNSEKTFDFDAIVSLMNAAANKAFPASLPLEIQATLATDADGDYQPRVLDNIFMASLFMEDGKPTTIECTVADEEVVAKKVNKMWCEDKPMAAVVRINLNEVLARLNEANLVRRVQSANFTLRMPLFGSVEPVYCFYAGTEHNIAHFIHVGAESGKITEY